MFFEKLLLGTQHVLKNRYLHVEYKIEVPVQSANSEISKCQNGTLDCTLEELAVIKAVKANPAIKQKELAVAVGKSERTIKRRMTDLQEKGYRLTPGTYTVSAWAGNGNINGETSRLSLVIPDSARPSAPGVALPDENVTDNYASFVIDTTGVDRIVARYFSVGYTNNINYDTRSVQGGQNEIVWQLYHYGANRRYSFAVCKDGIWPE